MIRRVAVLLVAFVSGLGGVSCRQATDEPSVRKRETAELAAQLGSTRVTLYRVSKTAVRSLPPRDDVQRMIAGQKELTREQWAERIARDPALEAHKNRVGLFIVGAH